MTQTSRVVRARRAEAAAWIAKLHGPERSPELEEDFRSWLDADTENARAFEHVTEIWTSTAQVDVARKPQATRLPAARMWPAFAVVTVAVLALGLVAGLYLADVGYATEVGEQRSVSLEDGSRLHLNSDTEVTVDLSGTLRHVRLERGEAFFDVAKDVSRPFVVTAADRTITALGTAFVVRLDPDSLAVTLVEGRVRIAPEALPRAVPSEADALILEPGQRATYDSSGSARIDLPRPDTATAWRRGEVVLDGVPLSAAVSEMNRYQRRKLVLENAAIGALPVSGIYQSGNHEDFARAVAAIYDLEVVVEQDEIRLRNRR